MSRSSLAFPGRAESVHGHEYGPRSAQDIYVTADSWMPGEASLDVWIYFNLISNTILLPILVATFVFSKSAKMRRLAPLINMCIAWILSGIFSLLLFYNGRARPEDPLPSLSLCTAQLSLLYGILPMWSVAVLVLTYYVHVQVGASIPRRKMIPMPLLIMAPYVVQIAFSIAGVIAATTKRPHDHVYLKRTFFYCALVGHPLSNAMSMFVFVVCLGIILLKIQLALVFYRNWQALRNARRRTNASITQTQANVPVLRMLVFGLYVFAGMICNVIQLFYPEQLAPYMYVASAGTIVFLVFGTQSYILEAWSFWKWKWGSVLPGSSSLPPPTPNPLLTVENHLAAPPSWRDLSLLSPLRGEKLPTEAGAIINVRKSLHPNEPPTPVPRVQIVRHIYTIEEAGSPRGRDFGATGFGAAHSTSWF